jgi:L-threonylcarbamoyladenylate synthase
VTDPRRSSDSAHPDSPHRLPGRAEILPTHTPALFARAVERAAECLRAGEAVALPTETVYGLAANALDPAAVERIYRIKGRPAHNPLIVHVASGPLARACVRDWPDAADRLARAFWPGPLTLVLPRSPRIPDVVTAGGDTVGVRWPSHPFIQEVIRTCGFPLAAPSANPANQLSPTCAEHVAAALGHRIALIVDGGPAQVGIESTVLDISGPEARLLRPGMIHAESLAAVVPLDLRPTPPPTAGVEPFRSPGQFPRHYAPRATVVPLAWRDDADLDRQLRRLPVAAEVGDRRDIHILAHTHIPSPKLAGRVCVIPHDPEAYARALYAEWHRCDELGARAIVVEAVPDSPAWRGIADRLNRASTA